MAKTFRIEHQRLREVCTRIQTAFGVPTEDAGVVSDCLVEADLMGIETHGLIRLKFYMDRVRAGGNNPRARMRRVRDNPCTAVLDADNALGPVGGKAGMDLAIAKAAEVGIGMVLVRNCNHYGPAGHYARMPVEREMIGMSLCNVLASMPPTGGAEACVGNNPYAVAFPAGQEPPVVVDACTSKGSWGKVFLAAKTGQSLEPECYTDAEGRVTLDPRAVMGGGCLLPIAGHKGYGIAAAIELLTGMLAGAALDHDIPHPYKHLDRPGDNTFLMAAIRVDQFQDVPDFRRNMDAWVRHIRGSRRAPGVERIWLPGEIEAETRKARLSGGVPVNPAVWEEVRALAREAGVPEVEECA